MPEFGVTLEATERALKIVKYSDILILIFQNRAHTSVTNPQYVFGYQKIVNFYNVPNT